ncbi:MAG: hypothetical protein U0401_21920 [Anaerolineae bacterium]
MAHHFYIRLVPGPEQLWTGKPLRLSLLRKTGENRTNAFAPGESPNLRLRKKAAATGEAAAPAAESGEAFRVVVTPNTKNDLAFSRNMYDALIKAKTESTGRISLR